MCAEDDEEVMDGWDVVQRPSLPPPPCQTDEVEQWSRAMFYGNQPPPPSRLPLGSFQVQAELARPASAPAWVQGDGRRPSGGRVSIRSVARTFHSTRAMGAVVPSPSMREAGTGQARIGHRPLYNTGEG